MTQTTTKELITVKQLADQAKIKPTVLRRILRTQFPREAKGKSYGWQPDDPQIELILKAVGNHKANATQPAKKTEAPKAEKTPKPKTKAVPKPKAKTAQPKTKSETGA